VSERTGLGLLETSALLAVADLGGTPDAGHRKTTRVLGRLEDLHGIGGRYAYPMLQDLAAPYRLHLPLLDVNGNWGSQHGDPAADARYTEVRLSPAGMLAVAAERGEVGPLPLGLIEGSLYRDGSIPPFDPAGVIRALRSGTGDAGPPALPTGGPVNGEVEQLLAGHKARLQLGCRIDDEPLALVITKVPLGIPVDSVSNVVESRARSLAFQHIERPEHRDYERPEPPEAAAPILVTDVRNESSMRVGIRIVCRLVDESQREAARAWVQSLWPVTIEVDCKLPAAMSKRLRSWDAGDGSGLSALEQLVAAPR
jgi:hypothetical protein